MVVPEEDEDKSLQKKLAFLGHLFEGNFRALERSTQHTSANKKI